MTSAVIPYQGVVNPLEFVDRLGDAIAKSGMFGCKNVESGKVLAMTCFSERKSPTEIARRYHIIEGRLSMKAGAMLADFRVRGGRHRIVERTPERASIELTIDGQSQQFTFTWEEAQQEPFIRDKDGKVKKNYATPRTRMQMLWARVVSDSVEAMAPEIAYGVYTPEEISDFPEINGGLVAIADDGGDAKYDEEPVPVEVEAVIESAPSRMPASVTSAPVTAPCTQAQIDQVKQLALQLRSLDESFAPKFMELMKKKPINQFSLQEAEKLIGRLTTQVTQLTIGQAEVAVSS